MKRNFNLLTKRLYFTAIIDDPLKLGTDYTTAVKNYNFQMENIKILTRRLVSSPYLKGMILQGAPGIGKTFTITAELAKIQSEKPRFMWDKTTKITPTGMFAFGFKCRNSNNLMVFDDCDSAFKNEDCMNILKAMTDDKDTRQVAYFGAYIPLISGTQCDETDYGEDPFELNRYKKGFTPQTYFFNGKVLCITNTLVGSDPHLDALTSRMPAITVEVSNQDKVYVAINILLTSPMYTGTPHARATAKKVIRYIIKNWDAFCCDNFTFRMINQMFQTYILFEDEKRFDQYMRAQRKLNWTGTGGNIIV